MADRMNFDKYIDNPSGGAAVITNRNFYKDMYKSKFDKLLVREQGKIEWRAYYTHDANDAYFIYMKIPSEVISNFYYDVVVRLYTTENKKKNNANLREYAVEFYSNDPAFVYTFAHSFAKNKLFIKDLEPKMSQTALRQVAKERNPKDNVWYVKSLYFAYLTMERYHLFSRTILEQHGRLYNKRELLGKITHANEKVEARKNEQEKLNKLKAKEREAQRNASKTPSANTTKVSKPTKISKTSTVSKVSRITKMVKKSPTVKS